jgi:hypothetical protein
VVEFDQTLIAVLLAADVALFFGGFLLVFRGALGEHVAAEDEIVHRTATLALMTTGTTAVASGLGTTHHRYQRLQNTRMTDEKKFAKQK